MKANKAPEKLYVDVCDNLSDSILYGFTEKRKDDDIEYVRKDVFIEKAWNWIEDNILSSNQQDKSRLYFEQFKKYLKGE